jgi:prolyl 4-hydroxylase
LNHPISLATIEKHIEEHKEFPFLSYDALTEILRNWGIKTVSYNWTLEKLIELPPLSILFINEKEDNIKVGRFVMLYSFKGDIIEYLHPRKGWVLEYIKEFASKWSNAAMSIIEIEDPHGEPDFELKEEQYNKAKYENPELKNNVRIKDNFLTDEECKHIIDLAMPILKKSRLMAEENIEGYGRTSNSAEFHVFPNDEILNGIRKRASEILVLPESHFEFFQCVSYEPNQEYQNHYDTFDEESDRGRKEIEENGQRKYTMLAYLNDDFDGGATYFPNLDFVMRPKKGRVVIFNNLDADGKVIKAAYHAGLPVTEGRKFAVNIWVRNKPIKSRLD